MEDNEFKGEGLSVPLLLAEQIADRFEGFEVDHVPDGWPAIQQRELSEAAGLLRRLVFEIERLNRCLTWEQNRAEHIGTHGPGCAMWGPRHYECLLRAYEALKERTIKQSLRVPLHDMAILDLSDTYLYDGGKNYGVISFARAIERAHGIGEME